MRLLNLSSRLLEAFSDESIPEYAILSHTWGNEEASFQDWQAGKHEKKIGYGKIDMFCRLSATLGIGFVWVDTCCIDKTSSAELSEAINSMFKWYRQARICIAYLSDVPPNDRPKLYGSLVGPAFCSSRWFKRGWTLQELLAPVNVRFFDAGWNDIGSRGTKSSSRARGDVLTGEIWDITGIDCEFLTGSRPLADASVATRMSWAACRQTTRKEDVAYCLLGIFDINMPLLYGEGAKAFLRLQQELLTISDDETLFAWHYNSRRFYDCHHGGLFVVSPKCFASCGQLVPLQSAVGRRGHYTLTNKGLHIERALIQPQGSPDTAFMLLNCTSPAESRQARPVESSYHSSNACIVLPLSRYRTSQSIAVSNFAGEEYQDIPKFWRSVGSVPFLASKTYFEMARLTSNSRPSTMSATAPGTVNPASLTFLSTLLRVFPGPWHASPTDSPVRLTSNHTPRRRHGGGEPAANKEILCYGQAMPGVAPLYLHPSDPPLKQLPFFALLEANTVEQLKRHGLELTRVYPPHAVHLTPTVDKSNSASWMLDINHVKDVHENIFLLLTANDDSADYWVQIELDFKPKEISPIGARDWDLPDTICGGSLSPSRAVITTLKVPIHLRPWFMNQVTHPSHLAFSNSNSNKMVSRIENIGLQFDIFLYRKTLTYAICYRNEPQDVGVHSQNLQVGDNDFVSFKPRGPSLPRHYLNNDDSNREGYICVECGWGPQGHRSHWESDIRKHRRLHYVGFECDMCDKFYNRNDNLVVHHRNKHGVNKLEEKSIELGERLLEVQSPL